MTWTTRLIKRTMDAADGSRLILDETEWRHQTRTSAERRADALAGLHGTTYEEIEHGDTSTFVVDASDWYIRKADLATAKCVVCGEPTTEVCPEHGHPAHADCIEMHNF